MEKIKGHKPSMVESLVAEAKAELLKENKEVWIREIKEKMKTLEQAEKIVANCKLDIEDMEIRIAEETS